MTSTERRKSGSIVNPVSSSFVWSFCWSASSWSLSVSASSLSKINQIHRNPAAIVLNSCQLKPFVNIGCVTVTCHVLHAPNLGWVWHLGHEPITRWMGLKVKCHTIKDTPVSNSDRDKSQTFVIGLTWSEPRTLFLLPVCIVATSSDVLTWARPP